MFDAGTVLFPLAYIAGDIITEVYGFRRMRRLIVISVAMMLLTSATFGWCRCCRRVLIGRNQAAYDLTLGVVWRSLRRRLLRYFSAKFERIRDGARQSTDQGEWLVAAADR